MKVKKLEIFILTTHGSDFQRPLLIDMIETTCNFHKPLSYNNSQ